MKVATTTGELAYRGPDRRGLERREAVSLNGRRAARDGLLLVCAAATGPTVALLLHSAGNDVSLGLELGIAASIAATMAGFAALIRHRLAGDAPMAYLGLGLLGYGGSVAPLTAVTGQLHRPAADLESLRLAALVAVGVLFLVGLMVSEVDTAVTGRRLAWVSVVGITALAVALETSARVWGVATNDVVTRAMIPLWLAVACGYLAAGIRRRRAAFWRAGGGLLVITLAHLMRAADPSPTDLVALSLSAVRLVGAAAIVLGLLPDMLAALSARRRADVALRDRWMSAEAERLRVLRDVRERRHEMANALSGIAGANSVLDLDSPVLDRHEAALLRQAVQQEVERLQHLVGHDAPQPHRAFAVNDVVQPLLAARTALGEKVTFSGDPTIEAFGSPEALSQILVNLLTNCARHATGGNVEVTAGRERGRVLVRVVDDGPQAPTSRHTGSGIGLVVSARIAEQHGGCLRLIQRELGFGVAVELPAVPATLQTCVPRMRRHTPSEATS